MINVAIVDDQPYFPCSMSFPQSPITGINKSRQKTKTTNSVRPTSLTIIASCSQNGNTYPVGPTPTSPNTASNVFPGNTTQVIWNPYQWEQIPGQVPFAAASYVLKIFDERGQNAPIKGGYLSPYSGTQFGIYRPQGYTPLASEFMDWVLFVCLYKRAFVRLCGWCKDDFGE